MNLLNLESEKFKNVEVKGYKFKIRFISPLDRVQISQHRMTFQNGNPVESLTQDEFNFFENIAIVNLCTDEYPEEFNENESCVKWDDVDLINLVAKEIQDHTNDIQSKLKKNRPVSGGK